ncbi:MTH1187 family thiamine-binding protein [Nesterenkonia rhizosphaerae]|uniref:MTH1187 family thiamine-binding protein n=1 Tax=Nesterenkonia rhizosphaerae TaxID=1348272 RepID=A0ABP9FPA4_9MICC
MLAAFSVAPTTAQSEDGSVSKAVAEAVRIVRDSGLPYETNSMFTTVEGEWDEVFAVIKQATDAVTAVAPRVSLVVKADIRPGYTNQLEEKVQRVEEQLRA